MALHVVSACTSRVWHHGSSCASTLLGCEAEHQTRVLLPWRRFIACCSGTAGWGPRGGGRAGRAQDQRKSLKAHRRAALSGKGLNDDFADDVADIIAAADGAGRSAGCAAAAPPQGRFAPQDHCLRWRRNLRRQSPPAVRGCRPCRCSPCKGGTVPAAIQWMIQLSGISFPNRLT